MSALAEWTEGVSISAPIPTSTFPIATLIAMSAGLFVAGNFVIQGNKTPLLQQIQTAISASILLGFGTIFASNAAGVYL